MRTRKELESQWADLRRVSAQSDVARVVEALDRAIGSDVEEEPRRRLKVPYVNAVPLDRDDRWN